MLTPWVVAGIPAQALLGLGVPIGIIVVLVGSLGMFYKQRPVAVAASLGLLFLLVYGKAAVDVLGLSQPDTAFLLLQFSGIIFLMEAGGAVLSFDDEHRDLRGKTDEVSGNISQRLSGWIQGQLWEQGKIATLSVVLSLALLVIGSIASISFNQLAFSAALVILSIGVLLFVLTHRREPES
ncbi:MAG TPA: hypothetical protein VGS11_03055 [Candidatus Bathyarchaeia archaeon]|nr:hypothetical protein [Candidatus Bathyarchaeia archaeon]